MNLDLIKNTMSQKFGRTGLQLQKHSPEILLGVGLIGGVVAAVMAVKAAKKDTIKQRHNIELMNADHVVANENLTKSEETKMKAGIYVQTGIEFAKLYGPSVGLGVLSISAILGAHGIMAKRQVAITTAYTLLAEGYQAYRSRVIEELGEETDKKFHLGLYEKQVEDSDYNEADGEVKFTKTVLVPDRNRRVPSIYSRFFDETNPNWKSDRMMTRAFLTAQQHYANDLLIIRGHVYLNEVYERLGFPHTKEGAICGWVLLDPEQMKEEGRAGYISFGLENPIYEADREFMNGNNSAILLDFNVDGIMFDRI